MPQPYQTLPWSSQLHIPSLHNRYYKNDITDYKISALDTYTLGNDLSFIPSPRISYRVILEAFPIYNDHIGAP